MKQARRIRSSTQVPNYRHLLVFTLVCPRHPHTSKVKKVTWARLTLNIMSSQRPCSTPSVSHSHTHFSKWIQPQLQASIRNRNWEPNRTYVAVACPNNGKEKQEFSVPASLSKCMSLQNTLFISSSHLSKYLLHGHYQHNILSICLLNFTGNE